jgi:uncharacterized protein with HEPN domain
MHRKSPLWLEDISDAAEHVLEWTAGSTLADYEQDVSLRFAVERSFEIIGEALRRLERADPSTAARIDRYREIIDFRNVLAHGYDSVNNERVWGYIESELPALRRPAAALLEEAAEAFGP